MIALSQEVCVVWRWKETIGKPISLPWKTTAERWWVSAAADGKLLAEEPVRPVCPGGGGPVR